MKGMGRPTRLNKIYCTVQIHFCQDLFKLFKTCVNSPSCGVITIFVLFSDKIFLKLFFKASASKTTILFLSFITFKIKFNFFLLTPKPGPIKIVLILLYFSMFF